MQLGLSAVVERTAELQRMTLSRKTQTLLEEIEAAFATDAQGRARHDNARDAFEEHLAKMLRHLDRRTRQLQLFAAFTGTFDPVHLSWLFLAEPCFDSACHVQAAHLRGFELDLLLVTLHTLENAIDVLRETLEFFRENIEHDAGLTNAQRIP